VLPALRGERQAQIMAGNLSGDVPSGAGYLGFLNGRGFTQAPFTASDFVVDVSDSGIDNGTLNPNHPNLFVSGVPTNTSRIAYARLEGTPNTGSTVEGRDGHGTLNAHIIGGYNDRSGFPHTDSANYHYGLGIAPFVRLGSSVIFDADTFHQSELRKPDLARVARRRANLEQQLGQQCSWRIQR
jgi:hypothetical protein